MFSPRHIAASVAPLVRLLSTETARKTSLYDFHVANGGKMVNFGGYLLPVQYDDQSISQSHLHTRKNASLFDVSHMLQTEITGRDCVRYFEGLCTADLAKSDRNVSMLTVFTDENGGILDDLIVTKTSDECLYVVSNAARKQHDRRHMLRHLKQFNEKEGHEAVTVRFFEPEERALIALQGPKAARVLQTFTDVDLSGLYFMRSVTASVAGVSACRITRCGYTGEDGFEISIPAFKSRDVVEEMLRSSDDDGEVKLAGLGARDSLRLEAGLCLYGNDIDEGTTPIEAGLGWLVAKGRRERGDFPGSARILRDIREGVSRKRVGFTSTGPPARHGAPIFDDHEHKIGEITSGCPSPTTGKNIAMGYVHVNHSKVGSKVGIRIREKMYDAIVTKMPFVPANYYSKPK